MCLKLKGGRRILDHVSGDFPHSHLHAIMGPSGSGKSSFITALIGKAGGGVITGNVTVWKCDSQEVELGAPCVFEEIRCACGQGGLESGDAGAGACACDADCTSRGKGCAGTQRA